ncbi:MAG: hypothetical protein K6E29_07630 [Cyanobacteria bacterium RUI128]|nr:hypothetical protein [Cyanobacteria bacterium RUI128]
MLVFNTNTESQTAVVTVDNYYSLAQNDHQQYVTNGPADGFIETIKAGSEVVEPEPSFAPNMQESVASWLSENGNYASTKDALYAYARGEAAFDDEGLNTLISIYSGSNVPG